MTATAGKAAVVVVVETRSMAETAAMAVLQAEAVEVVVAGIPAVLVETVVVANAA